MNSLSKEIGICFAENNKEKAENLKSESGNLKKLIQLKNDEQKKAINRIKELLIQIPNTPNEHVPAGNTEDDNEIIKTYGEIPNLKKKQTTTLGVS